MARFARESDLAFNDRFELKEKIPSALDEAYQEILTYVSQHQAKGAYSSQAEHWHDNQRLWLCALRYRYFHFSARLEIGNGPRFKNGKRQREYHDG